MADAVNDNDRERYLAALMGRLKLSGDVGLLHKQDADRLIENIPTDLDIFSFNREFEADPARAQRLLLYGAYTNIRPRLREDLVKAANDAAAEGQQQEIPSQEGELHEPPDENEQPDEEQTQEGEQPVEEDEVEPQPPAPQPTTPRQREIATPDKKPPLQQTETSAEPQLAPPQEQTHREERRSAVRRDHQGHYFEITRQRRNEAASDAARGRRLHHGCRRSGQICGIVQRPTGTSRQSHPSRALKKEKFLRKARRRK